MTNFISEQKVTPLNLKQLLVEASYVIPMYQRNYAWGKTEIQTLIKDIIDACQNSKARPYYIGTLVVFNRKDGHLEVIDGQQRFTTLTLLAIYLKNLIKKETDSSLTSTLYEIDKSYLNEYKKLNIGFESRPKSSNTLQLLFEDKVDLASKYQSLNQEIINGYNHIKEVIQLEFQSNKDANESTVSFQEFYHYLFNQVTITQVPVPEDTDLNHYFEAMNNRGEQLEKHEIVKARLLSVIENDLSEEVSNDKGTLKLIFHEVWEACANMNKYIQYGFNTTIRTAVFSDSWNAFIPEDFDGLYNKYKGALQSEKEDKNISQGHRDDKHRTSNDSPSLYEIITGKVEIPAPPRKSNNDKNDDTETYYSIINFPNFLLHVLKIMLNDQGKKIDVTLDDKKLLNSFEDYILKLENASDRLNQSKCFIYSLLKTKFLFDQYIIKRNTQDDNHWTIEQLKKTNSGASYVQSLSSVNSQLVMLQSAFHVSAPTMNYKHWLNGSLNYLYKHYSYDKNGQTDPNHSVNGEVFKDFLEWLARLFMLRRYLSNNPDSYYTLLYENDEFSDLSLKFKQETDLKDGISTPLDLLKFGNIKNNFVFAYLDYLIWLNKDESNSSDIESKKKNFKFISQGSVEHFYPQNPINATSDEQEKMKRVDLHRFGNLCLISHSMNSRVSNHVPVAKKQYFNKEFTTQIDSLKLCKMIETLTNNKDEWLEPQITKHENEMLALYEDELGIKFKDTRQ